MGGTLSRTVRGNAVAVSVALITATCAASMATAQSEASDHDNSLARGKAYFTTCAGCHGNEGEGLEGMNAPGLTSLSPDYIVRQLENYRSDVRGGAPDFYGVMMNGRAKALLDTEALEDVATYIASLDRVYAEPSIGDVVAGQALYENCTACHGANAEGIEEMQTPAMSGMSDRYIYRQLQNFASGVRGASDADPLGQKMAASVDFVETEQDKKDVAAYIASLR